MTQEELMPGSGSKNEDGSEVVTEVTALDPSSEDKITNWPKEPTIADIKGDL